MTIIGTTWQCGSSSIHFIYSTPIHNKSPLRTGQHSLYYFPVFILCKFLQFCILCTVWIILYSKRSAWSRTVHQLTCLLFKQIHLIKDIIQNKKICFDSSKKTVCFEIWVSMFYFCLLCYFSLWPFGHFYLSALFHLKLLFLFLSASSSFASFSFFLLILF